MYVLSEIKTSVDPELESFVKNSLRSFELKEGENLILTWGFHVNGIAGYTCGVWAKVGEIKDKHTLARLSLRWRTFLFSLYPEIVALVSCENEVALRWIKWLGFVDNGAEPGHPNARRMICRRA